MITGKKLKNSEETRVFSLKNILRNINQLRVIQGRTGKSSASTGGAGTIVWNRCLYQVPAMVVTNYSTNKKAQVLRLNGAGYLKRRRILRHKG